MWTILLQLFVSGVFVLAWGATSLLHAQNPNDQIAIALTRHVGGLDQPVHITHAGDGSQRLFVVEQEGRIRIVKNQTLLPTPFLDISARVRCCGEQGLLSIAFPPNYANKRYFYVNYTDNGGDTVVARYRVTGDPDIADPNSEEILLTVNQPFSNHNGGQLAFGQDGFLYIGMGDGGSAGDPQGNGQRPDTLLGKLLRIDVESGVRPYAIPINNPFTQSRLYRSEIWAVGLRNPWRFSFDRLTGDLYIGDVGQSALEEINFQPRTSSGGENYGWNILEGSQCFKSSPCNKNGLVLPIAEYGHSEGCSVTGGFVYRGQQYPRLQGIYFYGDYCSGRVWGLRVTGSSVQGGRLLDTAASISSFGEDETGEVYLADLSKGEVLRITDAQAPSGADLALSVTDAPDPVAINGDLTYTMTVTNNGPESTTGTQVNATLPANVTFVSAAPSQGSCTGTTTVNCQLNTLSNGNRATVTLTVRPTVAGALSLAVTVSGSTPDRIPANNTAVVVTTVSSSSPLPPSPPSPPVDGPDFTGTWQSLTQSCKGSGAKLKCKLKGTFVVQNRGNQKAASVSLQFHLSTNATFDAGDPALASSSTGSIKVNKSKKKKLKVTLPTGSSAAGQFVIAVLDGGNSALERDESNNAVSTGPIP